jgi:hypothetical protein
LYREHEHEVVGEVGMDVRCELTALVHVTQKVGNNGDHSAEYLCRNMPSRVDESQHHAGGEDKAEGENHEEDVRPEDGIDRVGADGLALWDLIEVSAMSICSGEDEVDGGEKECCRSHVVR